ncbi:hypothetical protein I4U23_005447 [Adineta vaga]|nr:hypothetical protein I4U23_005447 [Adineta vaga]
MSQYIPYYVNIERLRQIESEQKRKRRRAATTASSSCCTCGPEMLALIGLLSTLLILVALSAPLAIILTGKTTANNTTLSTTTTTSTSTSSTSSSSSTSTSTTSSSTTSTSTTVIYQTLTNVTEGDVVNFTCTSPTPTINIENAFYGVLNVSQCNCSASACSNMNATQTVISYCSTYGTPSMCWFNATNTLFTDTCINVKKMFIFKYYCN